jgi:hypothetical protein
MVEKKSIKIDPSLFTFSDSKTNKTRKKDKPKSGRIPKIKTQNQKKKDTLKKQSLLKMIRHHQEDKYKQLFEKKNKKKEMEYEEEKKKYIDSFESSKEYLENLMEAKKDKELIDKPKNRTIKDKTNLLKSGNNNSETDTSKFTLDLSTMTNDPNKMGPIITMDPVIDLGNSLKNEPILEEPKYGVLKGGNLPTYRNYFNKTQKNGSIFDKITIPEMETRNKEIREKMSKKNNYGPIYKKNKQKRIKRTTFNAGKSKKIPKIGVLISNKTIRNNTSLKIMKVKEVPISKIKKELVRRGLIKIGTITPNDVLRKMYETVELMCGDVQNHNPDNLLHNFINDRY